MCQGNVLLQAGPEQKAFMYERVSARSMQDPQYRYLSRMR